MLSDIRVAVELAKQGGRLSSDAQWVLADALKDLDEREITQVAQESNRNEDTLLQYARAAERWFPSARVDGVSFSAHRVALSHHDPTGLLRKLKDQFGSPTVRQVRVAMGLEGHEAIETLERGIKKLDDKVSSDAIARVMGKLDIARSQAVTREQANQAEAPVSYTHADTEPDDDEGMDVILTPITPTDDERISEEEEVPSTGTWKSPINTSDLIGM